MLGPGFDELVERANRFREKYDLRSPKEAVYRWHDCVGHSLFEQFTPPTLEGEMLAGRHQQYVACGDIDQVLHDAPAKFEKHLRRIRKELDPECVARKENLLAGLEEYLAGLTSFDNLAEYDEPFFHYLKSSEGLR